VRVLAQLGAFHQCNVTVQKTLEVNGNHLRKSAFGRFGGLLLVSHSVAAGHMLVLNRSMPSTAGATMDVPLASTAFSFVITVNQSVQRNSIYNFQSQYTKSGAVFPDDEAPVLTFRADCSHCTSKTAHMPPYLPTSEDIWRVT
jgi:hypothetical protein